MTKDLDLDIVTFVRNKKIADCPVCKLGPKVLEQLRIAREKGIKRHRQMEYLKEVVGVEMSDSDLNAHHSGKHV